MHKVRELREGRNGDPFAILSAIWILASNDENPEMSYVGLHNRLCLDGGVDEARRLVAEHRELFRLTVPDDRLAELKDNYLSGRSLPSWLREAPEGIRRNEVIARLTSDDFFRSQFRAERNAPRSPIEILNWGLQHIDRLRQSALEARDAPMRRWSSLWIPLLSTIIALIAIMSTMYVQRQASVDQRALKEYEVGFRPKIEGYTRFLQSVSTSFERAMNDRPHLRDALNELDLAAIQLEPFLVSDTRDRLKKSMQGFIDFCLQAKTTASPVGASDAAIDQFLRYRTEFRTTLYAALFK
jgi:hypothetical protein